MSCPDLCTAAKCEELERRISALEQALELLEASFEAHTNQSIPEAHDYTPLVDLIGSYSDKTLSLTVSVDDRSDTVSVIIDPHVVSNLRLDGIFQSDILTLTVADGESQDTASISIPLPDRNEHVVSNLRLDGSFQSDILTITVADGESQDTASISIPLSDLESHVESNLSLSGLFESNRLYLTVADGESTATEVIDIPHDEPDALDVTVNTAIADRTLIVDVTIGDRNAFDTVELPGIDNFSFDLSVQDHTLGVGIILDDRSIFRSVELPGIDNFSFDLSVQDHTLGVGIILDDRSIFRSVELPGIDNFSFDLSVQDHTLGVGIILDDRSIFRSVELPIFEPFVTVDVFKLDDKFVIKVSVNGNSDDFTIEIPSMNCDDLINLINGSFNNLTNQLNNIEDALNKEIKEVYDQVTIDISGTADGTYTCKFPTTEPPNSKPIPGYAQSKSVKIDYTAKGMQGLHENLKIVNDNLYKIYENTCKAIDPIGVITIDDLYRYCQKSVDVNRADYFNEDGSKKYISAKEDYEKAVAAAILDFLTGSKYAYLLDSRTGDRLISAPNNWITPILADFSLIQSKINNDAICNLEIPEDSEVVSIVASDKVTKRADGKLLVLHFVTPNNYPKRSRNSTYWQVQIPAAKDEYDWCEHFETLTWSRGNCFAELKFEEFNNPVSGFFKDKDASNAYFDRVLGLTTATEKNRVYHEHKSPQTNIVERVTRPYRAFIESVNDAGQAICHVKYVPPKEPCE